VYDGGGCAVGEGDRTLFVRRAALATELDSGVGNGGSVEVEHGDGHRTELVWASIKIFVAVVNLGFFETLVITVVDAVVIAVTCVGGGSEVESEEYS
ncbi:MAG: hypothetical protein ACJAZO_004321, partial [Myxococcota bacterium]